MHVSRSIYVGLLVVVYSRVLLPACLTESRIAAAVDELVDFAGCSTCERGAKNDSFVVSFFAFCSFSAT